jgi:hypothetical protein
MLMVLVYYPLEYLQYHQFETALIQILNHP